MQDKKTNVRGQLVRDVDVAMAITEQLLTGPAAADSLDGIATLRIDFFREFPYLYDGRREDELRYLRLYAEASDAFVITVTDSGTMVGAATGIPLSQEHRELLDPFAGTPYPVEEIFYVGELLFCPEYCNRGLGLRLVALIEEHVRSLGNYRYLTCATVVRQDDHPSRPMGYVPIDRFLDRAGFSPLPGVTACFTWREIDGVSREHPMQFWIKVL
jgi:GNAT superfamily N-acetyltransferase